MSAATANLELQQAAVRQHCKLLRMPTLATQFDTMAEQAIRARQTHIGYLEALLAAELEEREKNTVERRIREAHLPKVKTLEEFDFGGFSGYWPHPTGIPLTAYRLIFRVPEYSD